MMDFMTGGSLSNVLAPKLEIGQEALYDALRARDVKRATRIIKRVARGHGDGREAGGHATGGNVRRVQEADLNAPDSRGLRPIHLAAYGGMSESVAALIDAGVPVDAMGAEGNTALHLAAYHKQEGVVAVLMRAGASPNQENVKGRTAIDLAQTETTLTLLCPLHYAAERGMLDNLVTLLRKGVSANSIGRYGDTPLHVAAATGNTDAARLLLTRGGNPLRKNLKGQTPYDVARLAAYDMNDVAGRELVECLEIAAAEAASAAAATAAAEAKLAAERGKDTFHEGEAVVYMRDGEEHPAMVMKVHQDDEEPYYTVRVHATGRERQTDANHLVRSPQQEELGNDADQAQDTRPAESVVSASAGANAHRSQETDTAGAAIPGNGSHARPASKRNRQIHPENRASDWAAASGKFFEIASCLSTARSSTGGGDGFENLSLGEKLASAFAALPAEEVEAILLQSAREEGDRAREGSRREDVSESSSSGHASGSSPGEVRTGSRGGRHKSNDRAFDDRERGEEEKIAHVVADACRDMVLRCLLDRHAEASLGHRQDDRGR